LLKALGSFLREHREELYALSARTGATRNDARFDVDGGIGVLLSYASKGRELPTGTILLDGDTETLGEAGTFLGQHICIRSAASRCRSTPSTSRCGDRWRSSPPRSSRASRA